MTGFDLAQNTIIGFFGIGTPGIGEMVLIGVVAVLLFGSRLPEVARTLGGSYQQFRKGLSDIQSTIKTDIDLDRKSLEKLVDYSDVDDDIDEPTGPKFDPPLEEAS